MNEEIKEPKNLRIKIGTPEEAEWNRILKVQEESLRNSKINVKIAERTLELAKEEVAKEKQKFKEKN